MDLEEVFALMKSNNVVKMEEAITFLVSHKIFVVILRLLIATFRVVVQQKLFVVLRTAMEIPILTLIRV